MINPVNVSGQRTRDLRRRDKGTAAVVCLAAYSMPPDWLGPADLARQPGQRTVNDPRW